jgi:hypothetical protein
MKEITLTRQYVDYAGDEHETDVKCCVTKNNFITPKGERLSIKKMIHSRFGVKPHGEVCDISYFFKNETDKDYFLKLEEMSKREVEQSLDFKNTITFGEMQEQAKKKGLFIRFGKNGLSFHKVIDERYHQNAAEYKISIKPIKDFSHTVGYCTNDTIYDLDEYNKKLNAVKPVTTEISDKLRNELYDEFRIVVFSMKNYFKIGMSYKGSRDTMFNEWCHKGGTGKLKYSEYTEAELWNIAQNIYFKNRELDNRN